MSAIRTVNALMGNRSEYSNRYFDGHESWEDINREFCRWEVPAGLDPVTLTQAEAKSLGWPVYWNPRRLDELKTVYLAPGGMWVSRKGAQDAKWWVFRAHNTTRTNEQSWEAR